MLPMSSTSSCREGTAGSVQGKEQKSAKLTRRRRSKGRKLSPAEKSSSKLGIVLPRREGEGSRRQPPPLSSRRLFERKQVRRDSCSSWRKPETKMVIQRATREQESSSGGWKVGGAGERDGGEGGGRSARLGDEESSRSVEDAERGGIGREESNR